MNDYLSPIANSVQNNAAHLYRRVFGVSFDGSITDQLLEAKKSDRRRIYPRFTSKKGAEGQVQAFKELSLRQHAIPLGIKKIFESEYTVTLITGDDVSNTACMEISSGYNGNCALEPFDWDMVSSVHNYDREVLAILQGCKAYIVSKDINATALTHFLLTNTKTAKRMQASLEQGFSAALIDRHDHGWIICLAQ